MKEVSEVSDKGVNANFSNEQLSMLNVQFALVIVVSFLLWWKFF